MTTYERLMVLGGFSRSRKWTLVLASLLALVPLIIILLAATLAFLLGCDVNEAIAPSCYVFGADVGPAINSLFTIGSLGMIIIPILLVLLPIWLFVEWIAWIWRRRRQPR